MKKRTATSTLKKEWGTKKSKTLHGGNKFHVSTRGMVTYVRPLESALKAVVKKTKNTAAKATKSVRSATGIARTLAWRNLVKNLRKTVSNHVSKAKAKSKRT